MKQLLSNMKVRGRQKEWDIFQIPFIEGGKVIRLGSESMLVRGRQQGTLKHQRLPQAQGAWASPQRRRDMGTDGGRVQGCKDEKLSLHNLSRMSLNYRSSSQQYKTDADSSVFREERDSQAQIHTGYILDAFSSSSQASFLCNCVAAPD